MASSSQKLQENPTYASRKVKVTILASEWGSSKGGLSTINRELAIQLAKNPEAEISFFVPQCSEDDKNIARSHNINIVEATRRPGYEELDWLSFPPQDLHIDVIVGHGMKLGRQAQIIRDSHKCRWVQVVHTDPEELGMFKSYSNPISKGEEKHKIEVELCQMADFVVGIGPKLCEAFRSYLRGCKKDQTVLDFTPGISHEFLDVEQVSDERRRCKILVFGRGDAEDFSLKGFDIAGKAVASLPDTRLLFVGAPDGKHEEIKERLLRCDIPPSRLKVRGYVENRESLKHLFCEADLVLMPSRTEGFGLTGLEALSAGLPVLVSKNSGFGEALSKVPFGSSFVIDSEDHKVWAAAIKKTWEKDRQERLEEAEALRISYDKKYSWTKQSNVLVTKMINLIHDVSPSRLSSAQQTDRMCSSATQTSQEKIEDMTVYQSADNVFHDLQQMQRDTHQVKKESNLSADLIKIASEKGFMISDNPASGNCMFYALSEQLQSVQGRHVSQRELRETLVRFLRENPNLHDGTPLCHFVSGYPSWDEYLRSMEKDGTWGDHLVLLAAANYYQSDIRVISSLGRDIFITPYGHPVAHTNPLVLGHIHEKHYVSIQPRKGASSSCRSSTQAKPGMVRSATQAFQPAEDMTENNAGLAQEFTFQRKRTNYARLCRLLVSVGSQVLKKIFDTIIPPQNLRNVLKRDPTHSKLQSFLKEGIVNSMQWSKLYPATPSSVSSTGFSPALLIVLLRTICKLSPPPAGWDAPPHSEDTSREADIARLKYFMNAVSGQAKEASVSDTMFSDYWQGIRESLVRLGGAGYENVIDEMRNQEMNSLDEEHFIELLKQWKEAEDNTNDKLNEMEGMMQSFEGKGVSHPTYIIERIRQLYRTREERLLPVPWCEDFSFHLNDTFTRLRIIGKEKTRGTLTDEITNMTGIFRPLENCPEPRTVLIEGDPGIGKTTYCQKLAYDWATKQEWDESFPEIEVLLLLRCHDIKSDIWEAIDDQIIPEDVDKEAKESFFQFIRENQSKVLLVLDGLDEADPGKFKMYLNLVESKVLPECHIVLTSRDETGKKVRRFCDTLWEIVGFREDDAENFIRKYFKNMEHLAENLLEKIRPLDELDEYGELTELLSNPLNTALLCVLCEDFEGVLPTNRNELYIEITNCVLRRYEKKNGFSSNSEDLISVYKEELMDLGRMALKSLFKGELYFEEHELEHSSRILTKFGFLSIQTGGSKRKLCPRYGFLHKSYQEFFAGFFLAFQLLNEEIDCDSVVTDKRFCNELKSVFLFMCGNIASQCEETTVFLVNRMAELGRYSDASVNIRLQLVFDCIRECTNFRKDLRSRLVLTLSKHLHLRTLQVSFYELTDTELFFEFITFNSSLTDLDFSGNSIGRSDVDSLVLALKGNTCLTNLDLRGNGIDASAATSLAEAFSANSMLANLNLRGNKISSFGASFLLQVLTTNSSLTKLDLSNNGIDLETIPTVSSYDSLDTTSLCNLNLSENKIGDSGVTFLAKVLTSNNSLTNLKLKSNKIGASGADSLSTALTVNSSLSSLDLMGNKLTDRGAAFLSEVLKVNSSLTDLNLSSNSIGDSGALSLSKALSSEHSCLTRLRLSWNQIGDSGAASLSGALAVNSCLRYLELQRNMIGDAGAFSLSKALKDNLALFYLDLIRNQIGASGAAALSEALKYKSGLFQLQLSGNQFGDSGGASFYT